MMFSFQKILIDIDARGPFLYIMLFSSLVFKPPTISAGMTRVGTCKKSINIMDLHYFMLPTFTIVCIVIIVIVIL